MKKIIAIILTLMFVMSLMGCQSKPAEVKPEEQKKEVAEVKPAPAPEVKKELTQIEKYKEAGKIVMGTSADFPPFESHEIIGGKDTIVGFDIDLSEAIAKKIGVKLEIVDMKFDGLIPSLIGGKIDFIAAGLTPKEERKSSMEFSDSYYATDQVLVVKEDSTIKGVADMKSKSFGAQLGTTSEEAIKLVKDITIKPMDKVDQLMLEVKNGRLNGMVVEKTVAGAYISKIGGLKIVEIPEINEVEKGSAIGIQKGNMELVKIANEVISELKSSGEYDKLISKYFVE